MLTNAQRWKFFPLARAAWLNYIAGQGLLDNEEQYDAWYREEMASACAAEGLGENIRSVKDLDPIAGYDAVMLHFAIISDDDRQIDYFSRASERRYRHRIKALMSALSDLENRPVDWSYARGIGAHMNLPLRLEDCPKEMLWKVIQALDTQRRRILAGRGQLDTRKPGLGVNRWEKEYHYRPARDGF
jgi:hypothetical protein